MHARLVPQHLHPPLSTRLEIFQRFTPRQRQIALLVARGRQNKEIASELGISPFTVRNLLVEVFRRAGVSDRGSLRRWLDQAVVGL